MSPRLDPRLRGFASTMRNAPSPPEAVLWSRLRASQLGFKFRRQTVIGRYIVDFFCPAVGLVVELDGRTHDGDDDRRRDTVLAGKGFTVLRFSNAEVSIDIEQVVRTIYLTARDLPPRFALPLPFGGGARDAAEPRPGGGAGGEGAAMAAPHPRAGCAVSRPSPEGEGKPGEMEGEP